MYGLQIAQILKDAHKGVYGENTSMANVFSGGNPGMVAIGLGLSEIAFSIDRLAQSIEKNVQKSTKKPKPHA